MGYKHGHSKKSGPTATYRSWLGMRARCLNQKHVSYKNYGARGISICGRWSVFVNFLSDMGECPDGYSLERIDNDGGYFPGNCTWASPKEQSRNKRNNLVITAYGKSMIAADWENETGIPEARIRERITRRGWNHEKAVSHPIHDSTVRIGAFGEIHPLRQWARKLNISRHTLSARIKRGWRIEEALMKPVDGRFRH